MTERRRGRETDRQKDRQTDRKRRSHGHVSFRGFQKNIYLARWTTYSLTSRLGAGSGKRHIDRKEGEGKRREREREREREKERI